MSIESENTKTNFIIEERKGSNNAILLIRELVDRLLYLAGSIFLVNMLNQFCLYFVTLHLKYIIKRIHKLRYLKDTINY